ncbi:hypothetical protein AVDCRST_MAG92-1411 [uncultured Coleofasciculus sp.]|uniref:Uncharacterized protein n=1 Tax=uncultured Coleofasciculus sp. TaxID=1267456 RepID=A0A6J4I1V5_9CYAN|nr:hypothetical protein AVDCRST_MAG92-1411 [uncultured Coleofasciculus sp.]
MKKNLYWFQRIAQGFDRQIMTLGLFVYVQLFYLVNNWKPSSSNAFGQLFIYSRGAF